MHYTSFFWSLAILTPFTLFTAASDPQQELFLAAKRDDPAKIRSAIAAGALINKRDEFGRTALYTASLRAFPHATLALLEAKASPFIRSPKGFTPFSAACNNRETSSSVVAAFINAGSSPYELGHGDPKETAFMNAAFHCQEGTVARCLNETYSRELLHGKKITTIVEDYTGTACPEVQTVFGKATADKAMKELLNHKNSAGETALVRLYQRDRKMECSFVPSLCTSYNADLTATDRDGTGIVALAVDNCHPHHLQQALAAKAPVDDLGGLIREAKKNYQYLTETNDSHGKNNPLIKKTNLLIFHLQKEKEKRQPGS